MSQVANPIIRPNFAQRPPIVGAVVFVVLLALGIGFTLSGLIGDITAAGGSPLAVGVFGLLGIALLIALAFEFVNGFHDTANAVATVIYTHSLPPYLAVIWSGAFNFIGVMVSSGAVAFSIVSLLPVELILQVGSGAGFAMIFALLIAAIIWNLGTWWFGLPASSSHTLIGSIIGVGLANQLMAPAATGTSGVDWTQAGGVFRALAFSPIVGFVLSALLLLAMRALVRNPALYEAPRGSRPPPVPIRALLILTCTGVSFAHGSNDGQKGMGLIMLILIGAVPTAFALNRGLPASASSTLIAATERAQSVFTAHAGGITIAPAVARQEVTASVRNRALQTPREWAALSALAGDIATQLRADGSMQAVPTQAVQNVRNDMYLADEATRFALKSGNSLSQTDRAVLADYRKQLDGATKFIPYWVKIAVAIALGLGTMVGWKRIVVTVGERIGKSHLTYGQGAAAELVAAGTIGLADVFGLPVSTTHVLSSGVAGTMAASGAGLQWSTVRSIALAWVLTLPAAILLAGGLYWFLRQFV